MNIIITIIQAILGPSSIQYEGSKLYPIPQWVASASFSYNFVVTQAIVRGIGSTRKKIKVFENQQKSLVIKKQYLLSLIDAKVWMFAPKND